MIPYIKLIDLIKVVRKHFQSEANRKEFEDWYFCKYGKRYKWKVEA